jgi:DNA polymerase-3 subunit chi
MANLDFHVNVDPGMAYVCRLIRKIRTAGKSALVYSRQADKLNRLDQALWTFSVLDFIPHVMLPSPRAKHSPVWLTSSVPDQDRHILILLDDDLPPRWQDWFARFDKVIDIVSTDDVDRQQGRARFKAYRDAGLQPTAHDLAQAN